jgi:Peptidase MA superfamily
MRSHPSFFRIIPVFSTLLFILVITMPVMAQTEQLSTSALYDFGKQITFNGVFKTDQPIHKAQLYFQTNGSSDTSSGLATINPGNEVEFTYDLSKNPVRAFSSIQYWFEITLEDGHEYTSPHSSIYYEDNRFTWQSRQAGQFRVHWYDGDATFAQNILDVANQGLKSVQSLLPYTLNNPVDIYTYANAAEMRQALQSMNKNWIGAHTDPDLSVMVLSLPAGPEQRLEMERQIPHELMHIMLYQSIGRGYVNLPTWLNEGLASVAELYPNPEYLSLLHSAYQKGSLLPMSSLCQLFPQDASGAFLAYAQATSFTRYLHQQFGSSGLEQLVSEYADGLDCSRGAQVALGSSLTQLERQWRGETFGENVYLTALSNLLPWLVLLGLVLLVPTVLILTSMRRKSTEDKVWITRN